MLLFVRVEFDQSEASAAVNVVAYVVGSLGRFANFHILFCSPLVLAVHLQVDVVTG